MPLGGSFSPAKVFTIEKSDDRTIEITESFPLAPLQNRDFFQPGFAAPDLRSRP
jgi:hypothetical protein